eukprot:m.8820 g.8820  ORF g.8820 m.8820 type:complete len:295 (+) comp6751_c0_seq2:130-1014(+)
MVERNFHSLSDYYDVSDNLLPKLGTPVDDDTAAAIAQVRAGKHKSLLTAYADMDKERERMKRSYEYMKRHREDAVRKMFGAEQKKLHANHRKARAALRSKMIADLEVEREKIKEWYDGLRIDVSEQDHRETRQTRKRKTKADPKDAEEIPDGGVAAKTITGYVGPTLQCTMHAPDIDADMQQFRGPKSSGSKKGSRNTSAAASGTQTSHNAEVECYYQHAPTSDERLWYDGKWYFRGYRITAEYPDGTKTTGVIFLFSPAQVWMRTKEGVKIGLHVSELAAGKYTMRAATGREQ